MSRSTLFHDVLSRLQPALDSLCPPPAGGWLCCAYEALCHGLFPDPAYVPPEEAVQQGLSVLIAAMDEALEQEREPFDPLSDLLPVAPALCGQSRVREEYAQLMRAVRQSHFLMTLRLGREIMPFDPASHTIGVHNMALHTACLAQKAGLAVDVPLVAGAALCHDIGKFGCRGEDARRIPFLHYYYTWQWLTEHGLEQIAHVSANHSTWDLEFENLPIESLMLIYADFRVRGTREAGGEVVRIYPLSTAYEMIRSKLYHVTPEKTRRYHLAYSKLRDFERFLHHRGVGTELSCAQVQPREKADVALAEGADVLDALRDLTFENSIALMHTISTDASFEQLLEQARGEKSSLHLRTYLRLFEEYSTYMTRGNKQKLLSFLYELLMHPEGDIRRFAADIMGQLLANSGPKYRKELPSAAPKEAMAPTMLALLDESVALWKHYVTLCLYPDHKLAHKHALRISNSLKAICASLFSRCEPELAPELAAVLFEELPQLSQHDAFVVLDALCHVPPEAVSPGLFATAREQLLAMLQSGTPRWQLIALQCIHHLRACADEALLHLAAQPLPEQTAAVRWSQAQLFGAPAVPPDGQEIAALYLSNLKNAVHWTVKNVQIDMLRADALRNPHHAFHTAMHLSNLLSVSEHLPVRQHAGDALLAVCGCLAVDQRNEIAVDLIRELENGQEQISRFIAPYLGRLLCTLPEKELWEMLDFLEGLLRSGTVRPVLPVLLALRSVIAAAPAGQTEVVDACLGLLLTGVAHYHPAIHQSALRVLCHGIIADESLPEELRAYCFLRVSKKLLSLLSDPARGQLTFFNRAAMLNHLYRFLVRHEVEKGEFSFPPRKPVAFFPGTFDPFSAGHKAIVSEIRRRGFAVYLAVDEFSWSKRTLPHLLRRRIVQMSVADQWDACLFPDEIPINIAMQEDLQTLQRCFAGREVWLVAGSDVIHNASAYRAAHGAADMNHIIVRRPASEEAGLPPAASRIRGKTLEFFLPEQLEGISSSRIRDAIDKNLDISALVDPIVQAYIYEYGLYLRAPMLKELLQPQNYSLRCEEGEGCLTVSLCDRGGGCLGSVSGRTCTIARLYEVFGDVEVCSSIRRKTSGKLLLIDGLHADAAHMGLLLNELLVRSLRTDHTYALCRCGEENAALRDALEELGFLPLEGAPGLFCADMRAPMVLVQDVLQRLKEPHRTAPAVLDVIRASRPRLRRALAALSPGRLLLRFDAELLNQALLRRVQEQGDGTQMCVPYGKILADEIVPGTVTKALHVDKCFAPDGSSFSIVEYPGYSPLPTQIRTVKAFRRPVLLVDDLLHKGYRIAKLAPLFAEQELEIHRVIVGILSGRGRDLMQEQGLQVDGEYFIPNLQYWVTESLLYPFIGGDTVGQREADGRMLPSANLILPYFYPRHFSIASDAAIRALSRTALENALRILRALEQVHQQTFSTALTLRRLSEAISHPRLPDRGREMHYDLSVPASAYVRDDLLHLDRIRMRGDAVHGI